MRPALFICVLLVACGDGQERKPESKAEAKVPADAPLPSDPPSRAARLWSDISPAYASWDKATEQPNPGTKGHGQLTRISYNETAKAAIAGTGPWPDGSIFVKENFAAEGQLAFVSVMAKDDGRWFWAQFEGDGTVSTEPADAKRPGAPLAGDGPPLACPACHKIKGQRDFVIDTLLRG